MKKIILFVVTICMLAALFVGCGYEKADSNPTEETKIVYENTENTEDVEYTNQSESTSENLESTEDVATTETEAPEVTEPIVTEPIVIEPVITEPTEEIVNTENVEQEYNKDEWISLGVFKITFYCACEKCNGKWFGYPTASGTDYVEGRTIAVDKSVIKLGTKVKIKGWGEYIAEDTGVEGNHIDIFLNSHSQCYEYGEQYREVWIKNNY